MNCCSVKAIKRIQKRENIEKYLRYSTKESILVKEWLLRVASRRIMGEGRRGRSCGIMAGRGSRVGVWMCSMLSVSMHPRKFMGEGFWWTLN